jgi:asparagine synthetase B (glutamine-hydrolysing)
MALYFAARGVGKVRRSITAEPELYTSPARVLLNGLGSDELLGGYGRHRTAYSTGGWKAVVDEVGFSQGLCARISDIISTVSSNSRWIAFQRAISAATIA